MGKNVSKPTCTHWAYGILVKLPSMYMYAYNYVTAERPRRGSGINLLNLLCQGFKSPIDIRIHSSIYKYPILFASIILYISYLKILFFYRL